MGGSVASAPTCMEQMDSIFSSNRQRTNSALPLEVYDSVVRSLHGDKRALFTGMLATWISVFLVWNRTRSDVILIAGIVLVVAGILRALSILRFQKIAEGKLTLPQLRTAEARYRIWSGLYVGIMGMICFIAMAVTSDDTVHLMMISTTLAYIIGIAGRNFASARVVNVQVMAVSAPLVAGLMIFGNAYHMLLAILLIPFLLAMHSIALRLRQLLFNAVFTAMDHKTIAERFEVALENASHGMAMVDRHGEFLVANEQFHALYGMNGDEVHEFTGLESLAAAERHGAGQSGTGHASGHAHGAGNAELAGRMMQSLRSGRKERFTHARADGVTIEINFNPMEDGAGVIVLEDITDRIKSETEIRQLADYDPLTHLPNRRHFTTLVESRQAESGGRLHYSLYFADLDNFKDINDSLGHAVGDKLLCALSLRMRSQLPSDGIICRFGGDEFVILLPGITDHDACRQFAETIIAEISKPVLIDGHLIIVGSSVGIALCPENGTELDQLLKMSDVALYETKARGRGNANFYSEELGERIRERRKLEVDLRRAVQRGELNVHYQPLIDLKEMRVSCFEALVRWHHPEKGNIPPSEFIPIAEEIGIISKIGKFVLEEAAAQCLLWPDDTKVAVNVSTLQFQQSDVCSVIGQVLLDTGLPANRLVVEVTESTALEDMEQTSVTLRTLSQSGVSISLDDFGTGFSSLSYLHLLPLDKVKIDRTFVESIRDDERSLILLSGVTRMAGDLGLRVVVEGIEDSAQLEILEREVHFDEAQGFYFAKPLPPADALLFVQAFSGRSAASREASRLAAPLMESREAGKAG